MRESKPATGEWWTDGVHEPASGVDWMHVYRKRRRRRKPSATGDEADSQGRRTRCNEGENGGKEVHRMVVMADSHLGVEVREAGRVGRAEHAGG